MREDLVTPATARRLRRAGLQWAPQAGDWCVALGGEHYAETQVAQAGLWLVASIARGPDGAEAGELGIVDAGGQWSMAQVAARDCVWLPSSGKLKMWLRARGLRVATREAEGAGPGLAGAGVRHLCRATAPGVRVSGPLSAEMWDGQGTSEAEAVAEVVLHLLEGTSAASVSPLTDPRTAAMATDPTSPSASGSGWTPLPKTADDLWR